MSLAIKNICLINLWWSLFKIGAWMNLLCFCPTESWIWPLFAYLHKKFPSSRGKGTNKFVEFAPLAMQMTVLKFTDCIISYMLYVFSLHSQHLDEVIVQFWPWKTQTLNATHKVMNETIISYPWTWISDVGRGKKTQTIFARIQLIVKNSHNLDVVSVLNGLLHVWQSKKKTFSTQFKT